MRGYCSLSGHERRHISKKRPLGFGPIDVYSVLRSLTVSPKLRIFAHLSRSDSAGVVLNLFRPHFNCSSVAHSALPAQKQFVAHNLFVVPLDG